MLSFYSASSLPVSCAEVCQGMAFDGCQYYLTIRCRCEILVLDCDFCPVKKIGTRRIYTAVCYDPDRACFWAVSSDCRSVLFKLDRCLQEIGRLRLDREECCAGAVTGLSFCCESGRLLISCGNRMLEADPDSEEVRLLSMMRGYTLIFAVVCLPPYLLFSALRGSEPYFVLASRDGRILSEEKAPKARIADAMVLDPCTYDLLLLTGGCGCTPRVLRVRLGEEITGALCPCNRDLCGKCGEKPPCGISCPCADLLESAALVEAAAAHVLNAEAEKLQRVIADAAPPDELLLVNESVKKTILQVTQLEQVLIFKLKTIQDICCLCEKENAPDCKEHGKPSC